MTRADSGPETFTGGIVSFLWNSSANMINAEITNVFVRLMVNDGSLNSDPVTNVVPFTIDNLAPRNVSGIWPGNVVTNLQDHITLSATSATDANALTYMFQVDDSSGFSSPISSDWSTSLTWDTSDLEPDTLYHWRVAAKDSFGNITFSTTYSFFNKAPETDFSKFNLRIRPNHIGCDDEKQVRILMGGDIANRKDSYHIQIFNIMGTRIIEDLGEIPFSKLQKGYTWDFSDKNLKSGIYIIYAGENKFRKNLYIQGCK